MWVSLLIKPAFLENVAENGFDCYRNNSILSFKQLFIGIEMW